MLKIPLREYQQKIINSIIENGSTLVVLPTGLGKTLIGFGVFDFFWVKKEGKFLFLAPTKPLSLQHFNSFIKMTDRGGEAVLITGEHQKAKRRELYNKKVIFATPQTIRNDLSSILKPDEVSVVVFDEAHRAVGDYAYVEIAKKCKNAIFIGLTASPGGKRERIDEVVSNLGIKNIEIREAKDRDVQEYVMDKKIVWLQTELSPVQIKIKKLIEKMIDTHLALFRKYKIPVPLKRKGELLAFRKKLIQINHPIKFKLLLNYACLVHLNHMEELLETQGITALLNYISKLKEKTEKTKSTKFLLARAEMVNIIKEAQLAKEDHPKTTLLLELLEKLKNKKILLFVQYTDQINYLLSLLKSRGYSAEKFIGKRKGFTKKQQEQIVQDFRNDKFNILVCSSIGEEGIDIPSSDVVIFYEPIPSEIRTIQRRGRVGRLKEGYIYILMTRKTRDEAFYWSASRKEKKMVSILKNYDLGKQKHPEKQKEEKIKKSETKQTQRSLIDFFT
ncbi:MAG: DEAD/DEAH box helicase family protein [Candidatus Anstonellales archaeon]